MSILLFFLLLISISKTGNNTMSEDTGSEIISPLHVMVISDLNGMYGSTFYNDEVHTTVAEIIKNKPDLVLVTGDMVAGQSAGLDYHAMWVGFHNSVTLPLEEAGIPIAVTPGNHDASGYSTYQHERDIFTTQWNYHKPDLDFIDQEHYPLRYAFMMDDVLFVSLDDTTVGSLGKEQMAWLDKILETPARSKVVFGHIPLYPFTIGRQREVIGDPKLEDMFNENDVNLFISGHHHAYYPGRRGHLQLLSTPCLGAAARPLIGTEERSAKGLVSLILFDDNEFSIEGFDASNEFSLIDRETLPHRVGSEEYTVWRDDLIFQYSAEDGHSIGELYEPNNSAE
jgi:acid phosphatase type 7